MLEESVKLYHRSNLHQHLPCTVQLEIGSKEATHILPLGVLLSQKGSPNCTEILSGNDLTGQKEAHLPTPMSKIKYC